MFAEFGYRRHLLLVGVVTFVVADRRWQSAREQNIIFERLILNLTLPSLAIISLIYNKFLLYI